MLITMNYYCRQRDPRRDRKVLTEKYTLAHTYYTYSIYRILYFCTHDVLLPISLDIYAVR
jgi:hypothetical protein